MDADGTQGTGARASAVPTDTQAQTWETALQSSTTAETHFMPDTYQQSSTPYRRHRGRMHEKSRHTGGGEEDEDVEHPALYSADESAIPSELDAEDDWEELEDDMERRKEENNHLFFLKKFATSISVRPLEERSATVQRLYQAHDTIDRAASKPAPLFRNFLYCALCGWWVGLIYALIGVFLYLTIIGQSYSRLCWRMASYWIWPFGKVVLKGFPPGTNPETIPLISTYNSQTNHHATDTVDTSASDQTPAQPSSLKAPLIPDVNDATLISKPWRVSPVAFIVWIVPASLLALIHLIVFLLASLFVVSIPIAKLQWTALSGVLFACPDAIQTVELSDFSGPTATSAVLMFCMSAANPYYYKYSVLGLNIILLNMSVFVVGAICLGYIPQLEGINPYIKFVVSCLGVLPLAYYIGKAIASISVQSSHAVGAVLNATFGSMVELLLYYFLLKDGLVELVNASLTGSLLATLLFIPGLCMMIGGLKYEEQRFNQRSANVGSSFMFVSVVGALSPSVFQSIFGMHELECGLCTGTPTGSNTTLKFKGSATTSAVAMLSNTTEVMCTNCTYGEYLDTEFYTFHTKRLVYTCAVLMPLMYLVGLIFTLRTHAHVIANKRKTRPPPLVSAPRIHLSDPESSPHQDLSLSQTDAAQRNASHTQQPNQQHQHQHHDDHAPAWSRTAAVIILLVATVCMGIVAEVLVNAIEPIIEQSGIKPEFLGVTLIAIIPDMAEIATGIQFALRDKISLSIEVGTNMAVQICLIQMPALVLMSAFLDDGHSFTMVFNDIYVWVILISVIVMNYTSIDAKSDYFQGATLFCIWVILVSVFYFLPNKEITP
eukprot:m.147510 g.147510  ORF g.147510 m.147510 type:complete len:832 (-) comp14164_c0_seq18:1976-4471(-)